MNMNILNYVSSINSLWWKDKKLSRINMLKKVKSRQDKLVNDKKTILVNLN